jgi:thiol-disulfide isomerase/thioredoxin
MSGRGRRRVVAAVLAAAALVLVAGCTGGVASPDNGTNYVEGDETYTTYPVGGRAQAPDLAGPTLEGSHLDTAALRGKVVVLNFWGSWCAPCRAEAPSLGRVAAAMAAKGVQFVGINTRDLDQDGPRLFLSDIHEETPGALAYPNLVDDPSDPYAVRFNGIVPAQAIPTTLILDRSGRIAARILGPTTQPRLTALLAPIAAEKA